MYLTNAGSSWFTIPLCPRSFVAMVFISSSVSLKSQMSRFCSILSIWTDFGMMETPRSAFHLRATWAAVFPYFLPMAVSSGSVKMPCFPSANGPHACGTTPVELHILNGTLLYEKRMKFYLVDSRDDVHGLAEVCEDRRVEVCYADSLCESLFASFCESTVRSKIIAHWLM